MYIKIFIFVISIILWSISYYIVSITLKLQSGTILNICFLKYLAIFLYSFLPYFNKKINNEQSTINNIKNKINNINIKNKINNINIKNKINNINIKDQNNNINIKDQNNNINIKDQNNNIKFWGMNFSKSIILGSIFNLLAIFFLFYSFKLLSVSKVVSITYTIPFFMTIFNIKNERLSLSSCTLFTLICVPLFCLKIPLITLIIPIIACICFAICEILTKNSQHTALEKIRTSSFIIVMITSYLLPFHKQLYFSLPVICLSFILGIIGIIHHISINLLSINGKRIDLKKLESYYFLQLILVNSINKYDILNWKNLIFSIFLIISIFL